MLFLLLLFWIILNGKFTWEILTIGALICVALYLFLYRFVGYSPKTELRLAKKIFRFLLYILILIKEVIVANCKVIYYIYNSKLEVEPRVVTFRKNFKGEGHDVVLAESITLTPGTITIHLEGNKYTVHCLDREMGLGINDSVFVKQLKKMESDRT
ncbi:MAG: Na+/H+ antiporter subunit E [Lachnospiraceae bacterium]|nr:Na+/H+ antiporter subunit E [Lachnospiraceae bacterium]